ncbi:MAG: PDZ domain-containing protein [Phycisphaerae bacterium]|nr:PDZ domain-containing protein [Phycisphaerae bacterium]
MRYVWIVWICLAAVPLTAAQQTEERHLELLQHEPGDTLISPGPIQEEHGAVVTPKTVPHSGVIAIATAVSDEPRTYLGVRLDPEPLPELLVKHLRLEPETGLRIQNVLVGSPADKVGLEQDDLIVGLDGKPVKGFEEFVDTIRDMDAGKTVELKIIHLGETKTAKVALETRKPGDEEWKYPLEPEISYSWNPGRVFRLQPGQKNWFEVPMEKIPDIDSYVKKFMNEMYSFSHSEDGKNYTITIEGNPSDPQTQITVKSDETEIITTVEKIDKMPEPYRKMARKDLDSALKASKLDRHTRKNIETRKITPPLPFKPVEPIEPFLAPVPQKGSESMDKLQKQMKDLQNRLEQMEKEHQKSMEKLQKELEKINQDENKPSV